VSNVTTKIIPISDLRRQTSQVVQSVQQEGDAVYITQHGRPVAVLIDYERYEALLAQLEDLTDLVGLEAGADEPVRDYEHFLAVMDLSATNMN
jgi:prevent-host-death family protein